MQNVHVLGTTMVDAGSRAAAVTVHRVMDKEHGVGHVTGEILLQTLMEHQIQHCGKPNMALSAVTKLWTRLKNVVSV